MSQTAEATCIKVGTQVTVKEHNYHGDGQLHEVSEFSIGRGRDDDAWGMGVLLVPIFEGGIRGVAVYESAADLTRKIDEGFIVVGGKEVKVEDPVLVVETSNVGEFHEECAQLVEQGYKLRTTACSPLSTTDAGQICRPHFFAVFVHPSAL